ncbi:MAG: putative O-glycosylation ligase, exosortase A system-associated [Burkholderiaceae bacterium]
MRDIALVVFFLACVPFMLKKPSLGVIMWVWLSVMNPHRLTYGFAYDLQFAAATAGITFIALFITKEERRLTLTPPVVALALFTMWICLSSLFPFHEGSGYDMWSRVMKIMLMTFVALTVIHTKKQIHWMVWTIVFSLAFYGAKGGLFTLAHGGNFLVWGPEGSFIEGNNEVALAFVMTIPLMRYVQIRFRKKWQKWGMTAVMGLTALAAIGSHSRGALLAIAAMAVFLWWKSRNKFTMGFMLIAAGVLMLSFMPTEWFTRMQTIESYDQDSSAQGRINAWWMAFNLAKDRLFGGGFEIYDYEIFGKYAPNPLDVHAAHSIYFQVMAEHGFIGLFLFMAIGAFTWRAATDAKRKANGVPELDWVGSLMDMVKVSMVGYGVGGAFLSLAYFDVPYYITVIVVATRALVLATQKTQVPSARSDRLARRDRFGSVVVSDDAIDEPMRPSPRRPDNWRGHGAYARPARVVKTGEILE